MPLGDGWADLVLVLNASINYLLEPEPRWWPPSATWAARPPPGARWWSSRCRPGSSTRAGRRAATSIATACAWTPATRSPGDLLVERLRWSLGGVEEAETYRQRLYSEAELEALLAAAGLELAERRPMWPAIPAQPARGRTLWVARPPG